MKARARIAVAAVGGRTRPVCLRSEPPLVVRSTPDAVYLVGGAAGPLGGDDLALDIEVGPGAELEVRTAAASIALPGVYKTRSRLVIDAHVSDGGYLRWLPEPSVASAGCNHFVEVRLALDGAVRVLWRDELIGGRHGEQPGRWRTRLSVDRDGSPVLRHGIHIGEYAPGWAGPAVADGARAIGSLLIVDEEAYRFLQPSQERVATLSLAGGGVLVSALALDATGLRNVMDRTVARHIATDSRRTKSSEVSEKA